MLKQTLVLGLLTLSGLYSAHAQEVLTLEKALNTAFEHSPSLIQSKLSLEQRQLNLKAQDASLKSQFSLDVLSGIPVTTNTIISTVNGMPTRPKCHRLHSVSRNP